MGARTAKSGVMTYDTDEVTAMYEALTKYIGHFEDAGAWIIDRENDGSEEHPIQMPYLSYSQTITKFISEMDAFMVRNYRICGYSKLRPRSRKSRQDGRSLRALGCTHRETFRTGH